MSLMRRAMLSLAAALMLGLGTAGSASASHLVPASASTISNTLVNNYRQTISSAACAASGRTDGTHAPPFSFAACLPPAFLPGTAAALGPGGTSGVMLTAIPDDPATPADEGDIKVEAHLKNVICLGVVVGCPGFGAPYLP